MSTNKKNRHSLSLSTTKPDHCVESVRVRSFILVRIFPAFGLNLETYRVSPRIHSECGGMRARQTLNVNTFHAVDVRTLLRHFNTVVL